MTKIKIEDIQTNPELRELEYFYIIHGIIPGLTPRAAYRCVKTMEQHKRKLLKCPFCAFRLSDMDEDTKVELVGHAKHVKCQLYIRCLNCHKEVRINIA
ncbi:hypothetical protein FACS189499_04020 [Clostridia bacterium]|nr:hypothetical protein FACS189499_04020 [Clostridia bacterium]